MQTLTMTSHMFLGVALCSVQQFITAIGNQAIAIEPLYSGAPSDDIVPEASKCCATNTKEHHAQGERRSHPLVMVP